MWTPIRVSLFHSRHQCSQLLSLFLHVCHTLFCPCGTISLTHNNIIYIIFPLFFYYYLCVNKQCVSKLYLLNMRHKQNPFVPIHKTPFFLLPFPLFPILVIIRSKTYGWSNSEIYYKTQNIITSYTHLQPYTQFVWFNK